LGVVWALAGGFVVYGALKVFVGLRMSQEEEFDGADLSIHNITASPERETNW
jgi:Amt family ammonium transporter